MKLNINGWEIFIIAADKTLKQKTKRRITASRSQPSIPTAKDVTSMYVRRYADDQKIE